MFLGGLFLSWDGDNSGGVIPLDHFLEGLLYKLFSHTDPATNNPL